MEDDLEQHLRAALKKIDPSPAFESKVLTAARRPRSQRGLRWIGAIAAASVLAAGVVWQQEVARGEKAKARLMLALKVTSVKLQQIEQKVDHRQ